MLVWRRRFKFPVAQHSGATLGKLLSKKCGTNSCARFFSSWRVFFTSSHVRRLW